MSWKRIYNDLRSIRDDIKAEMMSDPKCITDHIAMSDVWEELADQLHLMEQFNDVNSAELVRRLIHEAMIDEADEESEGRYV